MTIVIAIPLDRANLCADCQMISMGTACQFCGSNAVHPVSSWLNRLSPRAHTCMDDPNQHDKCGACEVTRQGEHHV